MVVPEGYDGPQLEIILRSNKPDNTPEVVDKLLSHVKGGSVAVYLKDASDGELTDQTLRAVADLPKVELKGFMERVNLTKIAPEIDNMGVAARFVRWTFENIINEVEDIIDAEKEIKHT